MDEQEFVVLCVDNPKIFSAIKEEMVMDLALVDV